MIKGKKSGEEKLWMKAREGGEEGEEGNGKGK